MKKNINIFIVLLLSIIISWCLKEQEKSQEIVFNIPETFTWALETEDITVKWEKVELEWKRLKIWDIIQDIVLDKKAAFFDKVDTAKISDFGWYRIIETVPSLDTPVCTMQTKQLESAAKTFPDVTFVIVSNDTPFALQRFCAANSIDNLVVFSDARTREFWIKNGLYLPKYGLLTRSIIIVDKDMKIVYVDYSEEVTNELDLWNALAFLKSIKKE